MVLETPFFIVCGLAHLLELPAHELRLGILWASCFLEEHGGYGVFSFV